MEQLIKFVPEAAVVVLDHCIQYSHHGKNHPDYAIECNFELLDLHPDEQMAEPYLATATMVKYQRDKLLSHPLMLAFLNFKWGYSVKLYHAFFLLMKIFFVAIITTLVVMEKSK